MELQTISLQTADLAAQYHFYSATLGLRLPTAADDTLAIPLGRSRLHFTRAPAGWPGCYHLAMTVPADQFAAAREWLAARVPLLADPSGRTSFHFADWQADAVYFRDPDGNILELIARHTLTETAPLPFSAASLLAISEIGLVVDQVPTAVAQLTAALGVLPYHGRSETFTALGDAHGLLIVVARGRPWYPDGTSPAVPVPLTVDLTDATGRSRRLVVRAPAWALEIDANPSPAAR